jgi:hypothetical protein
MVHSSWQAVNKKWVYEHQQVCKQASMIIIDARL